MTLLFGAKGLAVMASTVSVAPLEVKAAILKNAHADRREVPRETHGAVMRR